MAEVKATATAVIVQAAENFVVDEVKAIAKTVTTKNAAEIKSIVNGAAKEVVAASDDSATTVIENIENGATAIGAEIVKGATAVVDAVERHPELIAEGALAIGIGIASLVQPELIVGSVALVGKIAADAAKETVNEIVIESSTGIVKGVSEDVTKHTAELAAQDAAQKAKAAALEDVSKDGSNAGVEATVNVESSGNVTSEVIATQDAPKDGEVAETKILTTVSGEATAVVREVVPDNQDGPVKGPIIAEETIHTSATATSEVTNGLETAVKEGPVEIVTTNQLTGDTTALIQKGSTTVVLKDDKKGEAKQDKAVDVATIDIKVLAKEVAREMVELEAASAKSTPVVVETVDSKVLIEPTLAKESSILETLGVVHPDNVKSEEKNPSEVVEPLKVSISGPEVPLSSAGNSVKEDETSPKKIEETEIRSTETKSATVPEASLLQDDTAISNTKVANDSKNPEPVLTSEKPNVLEADKEEALEEMSNQKEPTKAFSLSQVSKSLKSEVEEPLINLVTDAQTTSQKSNDHDQSSKNKPEDIAANPSIVKSQPDVSELNHEIHSVITPAHHAATHAAVLEAHSRITVLQESNDLLHQKLDTMQEALLSISKALAERPVAPAPAETQSEQPADEPADEPAEPSNIAQESELVATENNQVVLATPPIPTALVNKRMSVFGTIGWLLGAGSGSKKHKRGQSIATSTPATVPTGGA